MGFLNALPGAVAQGLIWGLMAIGLYISYKILDVADLTVDGSICTGACVLVALMTRGVNVYISLIAAFVAGALAGTVSGLFHTALGIPPILAGILTQLMLWSINLKILGKANVPISSRNYDVILSSSDNIRSIIVGVITCAVIIIGLWLFFYTEVGLTIKSTGDNEAMSKAQGINTSFNKVLGLAISNGIVALSGALLAQYQGFADINMGRGAIVIGLAAIIIGLSISLKIKPNFVVSLIGVVGGSIIYYVVYTVVIFLGFDTDLLKMLSAVIVAVFLAVPYVKNTYTDYPLGKPRMFGFKKALLATIVSELNYIYTTIVIAIASVTRASSLIVIILSVASIALGIMSINTYCRSKKQNLPRPIATLILGINAIIFSAINLFALAYYLYAISGLM